MENARLQLHIWILVEKKFASIHDRLVIEMKRLRSDRNTWMDDQRKDHPDPKKKTRKGTYPNNYKPMTCLPMMCKILTAKIMEEIYNALINRGLFLDEQNRYCKGFRETGEENILYINQYIHKENKTSRKNLTMAWINYKQE